MFQKILLLLFATLSLSSAQISLQNIFSRLSDIRIPPLEAPPRDAPKLRPSYDFIIIGAGSAGSVLANRLTENPKWKVLLIEAGSDESFFTDIPLVAASLDVTHYNWGYEAQRQKKACLLLRDGVCNWPSGKAIGGSTVIGDLLYSRGTKFDYDQWKLLGNPGWGYEDVLPYFKKSERAVGMDDIDEDYHGFEGLLNIEHPPYRSPLVERFLKAAPEFGYNYSDINGQRPKGFSPAQSWMRNGRKCSASKAFLAPTKGRKNLDISKNSLVTKILIDPATKKTEGVRFKKNGKLYEVLSRKEVILSAGATKSPQLLLLSGVGPKNHLQEFNITLIQDLPVGLNLQDHISSPGLVFLVNDSITLTGSKFLAPQTFLDYVINSKGPYTLPGAAEAYAFLNTEISEVDENYVDLEIILAGSGFNNDVTGLLRNLLRIPDSFYETVYRGIHNKDAFSLVPLLLKPWSRGRIMLKSKNPEDAPLIFPNFFDDDRDLQVLLKGIKMAVAIGESRSFQRYQTYLNPRPYPGCDHLEFRSDAYYLCGIQSYTSTLFHYSGTCKMGPSSDKTAVVDPELRVKGIKGLRVIDASIMPIIVAGHTNGPVTMIAEKGADLIKNSWS